ncbi:N-acetylmuramoyl-L-alanine amidase [Thalassococcus sp. BH17M4-6]|uniref:N-acetylmuramoyl-L-alanine amidase n=1 Tax=Thalassococcus sp. BH17M4-6 TaxID=3413148 RepID=UPI003BD3257B
MGSHAFPCGTPELTPHWQPSPNFGPRRDGALPDLVVIHYTAMTDAAAACMRLCDPAAEVSAHYLISETGAAWHLVDEEKRAWHAGAGQWGHARDVNSRSIGIELANTGRHPFPEPQMCALETLLAGILSRWHIAPQGVIGHSDMAPGRKIDPGPRFDWRRLAQQDLSIWPVPVPPGDFHADAKTFGYVCDDPDTLLSAFRDRFRPGATGPLSDADAALMADLARRFPAP